MNKTARLRQDKLRPNSLVGAGKEETVSCMQFASMSERPAADKPPREPPLLPSNKTKDQHGSTSFCLVIAGPGVNGIIGMHRFNIFLLLSCSGVKTPLYLHYPKVF